MAILQSDALSAGTMPAWKAVSDVGNVRNNDAALVEPINS
jgi:hypothetical protein